MSKTIVPNSFGGDGRERGDDARKFRSFCPPDIQPNTRIIALCGATGWDGNASPQKDGWFFSDFYLFHHLLQGTNTHQTWLTCIEPKTLVSKYKEFVHGSRGGDRRIVLDENLLRAVEERRNIQVIPPKVLLDRFLATLSVAVGDKCIFYPAPTLTRAEFNAAIRTGVSLSLCITSCYSGGWILEPVALYRPKKLNISGMAVASEFQTSMAWACSQSYGRAGGSIYTTAVTNALIDTSAMSSDDYSSAVIAEEVLTSPTYKNLCRSIYEAYKAHNPFYHTHGISFSAQDDKWDCGWRTRPGFPLSDYKSKWEELRQVVSAGASETPTFDPTAALGFTGSIGRGYHNVVKSKARAYMSSHPGADNAGENTAVHGRLKQFLSGKSYSEEVLVYLNDQLDYRLSAMDLASDYASLLGLQFADCQNFDTDAWRNGLALQMAGAGVSANTQATFEKYGKVREYIRDTKLFSCASPSLGYSKPRVYLAIALIESSSLSLEGMYDGIDRLVRFKNGAQRALIKTPLAEAMMKSDKVVRYRDEFHDAVGKVRARLRSLSPNKQNRASLP